jgi:MFS family permease
MYATGILFGHLVDTKGPRPGAVLGAILLGVGYFPIKKAYDDGAGSMSVPVVCFLSFLTGCGSCTAFLAAIKVAALNWPLHRGTATAFPLSAFGLSALFFTLCSGFAFPDDTSKLLLFLAIGTLCLISIGTILISVPRPHQYQSLAQNEDQPLNQHGDSNHLERTTLWQSKYKNSRPLEEPSKSPFHCAYNSCQYPHLASEERQDENPDDHTDEASSLLSSGPSDITHENSTKHCNVRDRHSHPLDISGLRLLPHVEFWLIFAMIGMLTGIGLMTINNIGNDAQALWTSYSGGTVEKSFIIRRQLFHVSLISLFSFLGRLTSGIGSDILVKSLRTSRFWCLVASSSFFTAGQIIALSVTDPHYLWLVSSISGLGYGTLFGVSPSLVADAFGISGLSLNWGIMILGPAIWGNIFNIVYGRVFDAHSRILENGDRLCSEGLRCYRDAYWVTFTISLVAIAVSLWGVWHDGKAQRTREEERERREHLA